MNAQVINHGMHGLLQTANLLRGFHIKNLRNGYWPWHKFFGVAKIDLITYEISGIYSHIENNFYLVSSKKSVRIHARIIMHNAKTDKKLLDVYLEIACRSSYIYPKNF